MRRAIASAVLGLLCVCALAGAALAQAAAKAPRTVTTVKTTVHLNEAADLDRLRGANLNHYLRAREILAAANEICRPGPPQILLARFDDADPYCGMMWKASYPPKKLLSFRLDTVRYIALVTVTDNPGKVVGIGTGR